MSDHFDPRFDPAFQRGYEGSTAAPTRPAPSPTVPVIGGPPPARAEPIPRVTVASTEPEEVVDAAPRRPNPFLLAIAAVSILLIGAGLYGVFRIRDLLADTSSGSGLDYVSIQVLISVAPLVLVLGVATGIGLLFVLAVRWRR